MAEKYIIDKGKITMSNLTLYGVTGGGVVSDTNAVQKAIDSCYETGGGIVTLPAGRYVLGKIFLRSKVTVYLQSGAHIIASSDEKEYPASCGTKDSYLDDPLWEPMSGRAAVFYGCDLEDVAICGEGTIDGHYKDFLKPRKLPDVPLWSLHEKDLDLYGKDKFRPALIMLENCHNVKISDIKLMKAPCYTIDIRLSSHIHINGIQIDNDMGADNSDGIHMTSCTDVIISGCDLHCGDDSIAIDSDEGKPSERISVNNCILASRNNCFRIFNSLHSCEMYKKLPYGKVRDVLISSCIIRQGDCAVCINADAGTVSNVQVRGITGSMTRSGAAFMITSHNNSRVEKIVFSEWQLTCRGGGYMYAEQGSTVTDVDLRHLDLEVCPKTQLYCCGLPEIRKFKDGNNKGIPHYHLSHHLPFFMQIVSVERVRLNDIRIKWGEETIDDLFDMDSEAGRERLNFYENTANYAKFNRPTLDWPAIRLDDVGEVILESTLTIAPHGKYPEAIVRYKNGNKISI